MSHVLVLIANPARADLGLDPVNAAAAALEAAGATHHGRPRWLAKGIAAEIPFGEIEAVVAEEAARTALPGLPFDIAAVPAENRRKRLLVSDMESTIIQQEMLDELAELVGLRDRIAAITARAMNGEIDFAGALRERVGLLKGLGQEALDQCMARITEMPGAGTLVRTMAAHGAHCVLVSGGFRHFTRPVAERFGFHEDHANVLEVAEGRLAGTVAEPILDKEAKRVHLERIASARGLTPEDALTVGDGANDLPMLLAAGMGVAFHAKPAVAEAARLRIDHGDLTALLYLQGYSAEDFATA